MKFIMQFTPSENHIFSINLKPIKMKILLSFSLYFISFTLIVAQTYDDYIGAGHSDGITVTTSSNYLDAVGENTINGKGMDAKLFEASRFLSEATFGYDLADIEALAEDLDFEGWIDNQFTLPSSNFEDKGWEIWDEIYQAHINNGVDPDDIFGPWAVQWNYTWWENVMKEEDQLRQRVAFALSQIMVTSTNSDIRDWAWGMGSYYDVLMSHSFGNYHDLMLEVALHPIMGYYLSHLDNSKAIPEDNIHPDENFSREIMQLFSIGLYMLNNDGTREQDIDGNDIPSYDNADIKELAKVFTGLGAGALEEWVWWADVPYFGLGIWGTDKTVPMVMYQDFHETEEKVLLKTHTIAANQPGMDDVEEAVEFLFNHQNVGPFVAKLMIQRLIKSNPSPAYIGRVADAFNDNGSGVRGDMQAVVKAILLDDEARTCDGMEMENNGRLREPTMKLAQLAKSMPLNNPLGNFWNNGYDLFDDTQHHPYMAPTVFNFYLPDHMPVGELANNEIAAPEFKLHNTQTATSYINKVNSWTIWYEYSLMYDWEPDYISTWQDNPWLDYTDFEALAEDPERLLNRYDILYTHGQLTDETRTIIRDAITGLLWGDVNLDRVRLGLYLLMISPDYNITK